MNYREHFSFKHTTYNHIYYCFITNCNRNWKDSKLELEIHLSLKLASLKLNLRDELSILLNGCFTLSLQLNQRLFFLEAHITLDVIVNPNRALWRNNSKQT